MGYALLSRDRPSVSPAPFAFSASRRNIRRSAFNTQGLGDLSGVRKREKGVFWGTVADLRFSANGRQNLENCFFGTLPRLGS